MRNEEFQKMRAEVHKWARNRERKFLEDWCNEAHVEDPIAYNFRYGESLTIYTTHPGFMIGKAGALVNKYQARLEREFGKNNKIKFVEINGGFANYSEIEKE